MKISKCLMEGSDCEYARKPIPSKYFKDRLKLILATKAYINDLVNNSPCLSEEDIVLIKIPFIRIMGFEGLLSIMSLKDKGIYVVEDIQKFKFPTTTKKSQKRRNKWSCIVFIIITCNWCFSLRCHISILTNT